MIDHTGKILVPGVTDAVAPLMDVERKLYENINFSLEELKNTAGVQHFLQNTKVWYLVDLTTQFVDTRNNI